MRGREWMVWVQGKGARASVDARTCVQTVWGARERVEMGWEKDGWAQASVDGPVCAEGVEVLHL